MSASKMREDLRRELGFWDALTIGAGTMIGAGLMVHRYLPPHWSVGMADRIKRFREKLGATTSPDEEGVAG